MLIVDDEKAIRNGLCILIDWKSHGFTVEATAEDGLQALDMIKRQAFDVILADIRMPKMDGLKLAKEIFEHHGSTDMIIMSGYKNFEYARTAIEYGVKNYILKPIDSDILIETLKRIKKERDAASKKYSADSDDDDVILKTKAYIHENYAKDVSLKLIADELHYNPVYLGRLFANSVGMSFRDYLNLYRVNQAAKLLEKGRYKVSEISAMVGYKDTNYFCRTFKNIFNIPPSEYSP